MDKDKQTEIHNGAFKYAKSIFGELITGVEYLGEYEDKMCFQPIYLPSFTNNPLSGIGYPTFILFLGKGYRLFTDDEFAITNFFEKHQQSQD